MSQNGPQGLGGRPVGYGRPPSSPDSGYQSQGDRYGAPPNSNGGLNRLISSIAGAQRARHGQDLSAGFQDFSYNETKMAGAINGLFKNAGGDQPLSDEQYRINTIEQVSYKSNELLGYLVNRYGRYFQTAKSAMNYFAISKVTNKPDPVCAEFIEEVASNQDFYRYCCTYACLFFTSHVTNYVLSGRSEELLKNESLQFEILSTSFINILGLAFMGWFENHPNSIMLNQKMFPETRARLESFESKMDELRNALINISVGGTRIPFPWKKGVIQRIIDKSHSGSATYETHQMYNDSTIVEPNGWGAGVVTGGTTSVPNQNNSNSPLLPNGEINLAWLDSVSCQADTSHVSVKPRTQAYDFTNGTVNDNWDNAKPVERKPEMETIDSQNKQLAELAKKVNPYSRLDYDFRTWFKSLPETNCYIINPMHLEILAKVLDYDPDMKFEYAPQYDEAFKLKPEYMPDYNRYSREEKGCIPIVRLDWHKGTYAFYNLYVGKENVEPMLTNPDKVLPYVSTIKSAISETIGFKEIGFDELLEDKKNGDFTPYPGLIATATCKSMTVNPVVVYGNSVAIIESNQEVIQTLENTTKVAKAKRPEVDVTAIAMQSMIPIQFDDVTTEMIESNLPCLLKESEDRLNCEDFFDSVIDGLENINSRELTNFVADHLTTIVNRWLVEKRFYSPDKNDANYLKVGNILEDYQELIDSLKNNDPATRAEFMKLAQEEFLLENFRIFSSSAKRDEFIENKIENAKTVYDKEKLKLDAENIIYIEKDFIVVNIGPMNPPDEDQNKVVICGSEVPQLKWLEEKVPKYMEKHFGRRVPVLVKFAKDTSPRLWALTKSGYCDSKFTLRQLSYRSIIPMMKVVNT